MPKTSASLTVKELKKKYQAFVEHDFRHLKELVKADLNHELNMQVTRVDVEWASDKQTAIVFRIDHNFEVASANQKIKELLT